MAAVPLTAPPIDAAEDVDVGAGAVAAAAAAEAAVTGPPAELLSLPLTAFSSLIIFSNSIFSSASFCLWRAIFSLNFRGFDPPPEAPPPEAPPPGVTATPPEDPPIITLTADTLSDF